MQATDSHTIHTPHPSPDIRAADAPLREQGLFMPPGSRRKQRKTERISEPCNAAESL